MIAEVINTGSELLLGQVVNTHLAFLGSQLFSSGFRIERQVTIPDGDSIRTALEESFARQPDAVFVTGGLGPTTDDLTRDILANMLGVELIPHPEILLMIEARFSRRGFKVTDRVALQSLVPAGLQPLLNDWGTAPGLYLPRTKNNPPAFFLPGPPRELKPMFRERVLPILKELFPQSGDLVCRIFRIANLGESVVEEKVGAQLLAIPDLELGYCARSGEVDVRLIGSFESVNKAAAIMQSVLRRHIYAEDDGTLEETVVRLLRESNASLATAESCTGGLLANRITNVPGASGVYSAGWVTYSNEMKSQALGIDPGLILENGAVSEPVAQAMAERARVISGANFTLSTTGIAGPGGGTDIKPVGTVFIGLATPESVSVSHHFFPTDRETFKLLVTQTALNLLRENLI